MLTHFLVVWLVTGVSLLLISKLPLGIEIDNFRTALFAAVILGVLNGLLGPAFANLGTPVSGFSFSLVAIALNAMVFALAAWLLSGFRLRWGIWSALIGPIVLGLLNALFFKIVSPGPT